VVQQLHFGPGRLAAPGTPTWITRALKDSLSCSGLRTQNLDGPQRGVVPTDTARWSGCLCPSLRSLFYSMALFFSWARAASFWKLLCECIGVAQRAQQRGTANVCRGWSRINNRPSSSMLSICRKSREGTAAATKMITNCAAYVWYGPPPPQQWN